MCMRSFYHLLYHKGVRIILEPTQTLEWHNNIIMVIKIYDQVTKTVKTIPDKA